MRANCVICTDIFDEINSISVAKCGHVYHSSCLTIWVGQSKSCPECRRRITLNDIHKLYFNFPTKPDLNSTELENEVLNLKAQLSAKNVELLDCKKAKEDIAVYVREAENNVSALQQRVYALESELSELRLRVKSVTKMEAKLLKLEQMNVALENDLEHLNNVKKIVNGTQADVEIILKDYNDRSEAVTRLATYCTCLKRELQKVMESKKEVLERNSKLQKQNCSLAAKVKFFEEAMAVANKSVNKSPMHSTPAKKPAFFNPNENSSLATNSKNSDEMDVSPLSVPFPKTKFNVCIKTCTVYRSDAGSQNFVKHTNVASLPVRKEDGNSIIKTGYNGLGGHTNFINATSRIKKTNTLKRKV